MRIPWICVTSPSEVSTLFFQSTNSIIVQMNIPNELVLAILKYLERRHLKSARLVCKNWSSCASPFLFDEIYVAPNKLDLEVFSQITQHPSLKNCVRRLIYEASTFVYGLSRWRYVWNLSQQTRDQTDLGKGITEYKDLQIFKDWIYDCSLIGFDGEMLPELVDKWEGQSAFNRGYQVYQEHAVYQRRTIQRGDFSRTLKLGLSRLDRLTSVSLEGDWDSKVRRDNGQLRYGTHLARRWHPFHLHPQAWSWDGGSEGCPGEWRHYWLITTALFRAERRIDEFAVGRDHLPGISPEAFAKEDLLGLDIAALSRIKRLDLQFATCKDPSAPKCCDNINRLLKLLGSMRSLERLSLRLSKNLSYDSVSLYNYNQVFPRAKTWNNLQNLRLANIASSATDLLRLLLIQMPRLRNVVLGEMLIFEGSWESVIECLRQFNQFTTFSISNGVEWYHHRAEKSAFNTTAIEDYIIHGGRHPCLSDHQPPSASEAYMLRIDSSLRDRLQKIRRPRTDVTV